MRVLLLKERAGTEDPYEEELLRAGFDPCFEAPLRFRYRPPEELIERLRAGAAYGGLVVTSPRGAEALGRALRQTPVDLTPWRSRPVYAVGPATAAALRELGLEPAGGESGAGAALAERIAASRPRRPLLFLCGNRRREELPRRLREEGLEVEELVVYDTLVVRDLAPGEHERADWVVCFSPSGTEALEAAGFEPAGTRLAAIGPTTAAALGERGWRVDAVAEAPTPAGLVRALREAGPFSGPEAPSRSHA